MKKRPQDCAGRSRCKTTTSCSSTALRPWSPQRPVQRPRCHRAHAVQIRAALEGLTDLVNTIKQVHANLNRDLQVIGLLRVMFATRASPCSSR